MTRSKFLVPAITAALLIGSQGLVTRSIYASPMHSNPDAHALKTGKQVKLNVSNSSSETLQLMIGETSMTVAPGATVAVSAAEGTKIVNVEATKSHAAGEVITQVSKSLAGATLRIS